MKLTTTSRGRSRQKAGGDGGGDSQIRNEGAAPCPIRSVLKKKKEREGERGVEEADIEERIVKMKTTTRGRWRQNADYGGGDEDSSQSEMKEHRSGLC